jgi:hypothetical protein
VVLVVPSLDAIGVATGTGTNPFLARGALPDAPGPTGRPASTVFQSAAPRPPQPDDANGRVAGTLREDMMTRSKHGLGAEGPVLTALHDATYAGFMPLTSTAMFVATVDDKGLVTELKLASSWPQSKEANAAWEEARAKAAAALTGKKLPGNWLGADGHGPRGAELRIQVSSDLRLPSGNRPKDFPVQPAFSSTVIQTPPNVPGPGLPSDTMDGKTVATFDVTDIGAKPRRVVTTRLVSAAPL